MSEEQIMPILLTNQYLDTLIILRRKRNQPYSAKYKRWMIFVPNLSALKADNKNC